MSLLRSLLVIALLGAPFAAEAQTRRGLIIGINRYDAVPVTTESRAVETTRKISNLGGAVNDAVAMRTLLTSRFGFREEHVPLLTDGDATRDGIVAAINRLLAESERGDVVVFYYAGHGSQRRNSLSPEPSKLDQTIVVADANLGAFDLRDKELARLFNPFVDKGVEVVMIFDSCHSGSIMRGGLSEVTERWSAIDERDAADPGEASLPEERGALVISAAQDYQSALERQGPNGEPRGVFTSALIETLNAAPPGEAAASVFRRMKARMQMDGLPQEPVLAGADDRLQRPVFGGAAVEAGQTTVAVLRVDGPGLLTLQGGPALGIREGAVLRKVSTAADSVLRVTVRNVLGVSRAQAEVTAGPADRAAVGDLFVLEQWVAAPSAGIALHVPAAGPDAESLEALVDALDPLRGEDGISWMDDISRLPSDGVPLVVMRWTGAGWELTRAGAAPLSLPRRPTLDAVRSRVAQLADGAANVRFFLWLPPTGDVAARLGETFTPGSAVSLAPDVAAANYVLVGRAGFNGLQYALMQPSASDSLAVKSQLPIITDWVAIAGRDSARAVPRLSEQAFTLAKIRSWLLLEAPPGGQAFPYRLAFRRMSDGSLHTEGPFRGGESFELELIADSAAITERIERRRIYVFAIDGNGAGTLLYPQGGNVANRVPFGRAEDGRWPTSIPLGPNSRFTIGAPYRVDSFLLLASDEVIEPYAFQWDAVGGATRGGSGGPLSQLLGGNTQRTRGTATAAPLNWSIDRVIVRTLPPN